MKAIDKLDLWKREIDVVSDEENDVLVRKLFDRDQVFLKVGDGERWDVDGRETERDLEFFSVCAAGKAPGGRSQWRLVRPDPPLCNFHLFRRRILPGCTCYSTRILVG